MKTREQWIAEAHAKSEGGVFTGPVVFAKVLNLTEAMRKTFGEYQFKALDHALRVEKGGHWKIVDVLGSDREGNLVQGGELQ